MRLILAVGLLVFAVNAATAETALPIKPVHGSTKADRDRLDLMEDKSKAASIDQEARNARFDEKVRRATGSVCSGCFAEPSRHSNAPRRKKPIQTPDENE